MLRSALSYSEMRIDPEMRIVQRASGNNLCLECSSQLRVATLVLSSSFSLSQLRLHREQFFSRFFLPTVLGCEVQRLAPRVVTFTA